jgi:hypothetical protein
MEMMMLEPRSVSYIYNYIHVVSSKIFLALLYCASTILLAFVCPSQALDCCLQDCDLLSGQPVVRRCLRRRARAFGAEMGLILTD